MKEKIKKASFLLFVLSLTSCGFGYSIDEKFTPLNASQTPVPCTTLPENVELFFEGEKYNFEYEKQGMIEVQGDRYAKDAELIEKLKKLAQSKCCDAVINLKKITSIEKADLFLVMNLQKNIQQYPILV